MVHGAHTMYDTLAYRFFNQGQMLTARLEVRLGTRATRESFHITIKTIGVKTQRQYLEEQGLLLDLSDPNLSEGERESLREKIKRAKAAHRKEYLKEKKKE